MVKNLIVAIARLVASVASAPTALELAGAACIVVWAGLTWGLPAVFVAVGVALLAKSLDLDLDRSGD